MGRLTSRAVVVACALGLSAAADHAVAEGPLLEKTNLFEARTGGYHTYRIPGIVVTRRGTVLAYCEGRRTGRGDWEDIDVFLRRSPDGGRTWEPARKLVDRGSQTVNNPLAIVDAATDEVHFLYCTDYARCFVMHSRDDGATFTDPVEITPVFEQFRRDYDWNVIATGPGHGIQLRGGRLVVPVWLSTGGKRHRPSICSVIYSDDHARTWHRGEIVARHGDRIPNPSETVAVELADGRVMLNFRNESPRHRRLVSFGRDGAGAWTEPAFDDELIEPVCMASLVRIPPELAGGKDCLVFTNPLSQEGSGRRGPNYQFGHAKSLDRKNVTVRLSDDQGQTWPTERTLEPGISGYSDMAVGPDGTVYCFYERGGVDDVMWDTKYLCVARFNLAWLTGD